MTQTDLDRIKGYCAKGALRIDLDEVRFRLLAAVDKRDLSVQQCVEMFPAFLRVVDELAETRTDLPLLVAELESLHDKHFNACKIIGEGAERIGKLEAQLSAAQQEVERLEKHIKITNGFLNNEEAKRKLTERSCDELRAALSAAEKRIEGLDDQQPYWLFRAMAEEICAKPCNYHGDIECYQSSRCITEWCVQCAAQAFVNKWHREQSTPPNQEGGE